MPSDKVLKGLKSLEALHLSHNAIIMLKAHNFQLVSKLKRLYLDDNKIAIMENDVFTNLGLPYIQFSIDRLGLIGPDMLLFSAHTKRRTAR